MSVLDLAVQNLTSPMVLFFVLGLGAALVRSDLLVPEAVARFLSLYLLMSIGFRGGAELSHYGLTLSAGGAIAAGVILSFGVPVLAYAILKKVTRFGTAQAAAIAGHYGSISAVTFVAVTAALDRFGIPFEGYLVAVAAAMETPAIVSALLLARRGRPAMSSDEKSALVREVAFNGSVVMLVGAFAIGAVTGERGMTVLKPFLTDPFAGFLCLFMLEMGLVAGKGWAKGRKDLTPAAIAFAFVMPLISAAVAIPFAALLGLTTGGTAVFITLAASSSYIAVPAAMRLALPEVDPAPALTLSLGLTFPFNLSIGIPLYISAASVISG